ncbi:MAG: serine hydrolase [Clostridia bacterium]|nr:serine hydrolase [Clostridia bacterium]
MIKKLSIFVLAVVLVMSSLLLPNTAFAATSSSTISKNLDAYVTACTANRNFHGSVLVAKDGKILLSKGYGMADFDKGIRNKNTTRFGVGSVSKQFTAMAIMQLFEKGKLKLDDKLSKYYKNIKGSESITIHHLLTHSSGIVDFSDLLEYVTTGNSIKSVDDLIKIIKDKPLNFKPGTKYQYCNAGYVILTGIIEKVSGLKYENYLSKYIFKPLGMKDSGVFIARNTNCLKGTTGYTGFLDVTPVYDDFALYTSYGAGAIYSTVEDLYKWSQALYTEKLLKKKNLDLMFKGHMKINSTYSYGYGFVINSSPYGQQIFHNGATLSYTSYLTRYTDKKLTIIVLSNNRPLSIVINSLADISFGKAVSAPEALKVADIDKSVYENYKGEYFMDDGSKLTVTSDSNHLYVQPQGQGKFEMFPLSSQSFFLRSEESYIDFISNNGIVTGLVLKRLGLQMKANKSGVEQPEKTIVPVDQKILDSYVGQYDIMPQANGISIFITTENGHLYAQIATTDKKTTYYEHKIFAESENLFLAKDKDVQISFVKNEKGEVSKIILKQSGVSTDCIKVK